MSWSLPSDVTVFDVYNDYIKRIKNGKPNIMLISVPFHECDDFDNYLHVFAIIVRECIQRLFL